MSGLEYLSLFWAKVSLHTLAGLELPLQTKVFSDYGDPPASTSWVLEIRDLSYPAWPEQASFCRTLGKNF